MKPVLLYLLQVIVCSGLLYGYYHLLLRNKKFHHYNRYYLLAATVISILVPFLNIPVYFDSQNASPVWLQTLNGTDNYFFPIVAKNPEATIFTWNTILILLYVLASVMILCRFIISIYKIRKLISQYRVEKLNGINFINTEEKGTPFSFFHWLFWNNKIELDSPDGQQIFRHEFFHIRQKHSWDIIFLELLSVAFWINPFFHLIKKELTTIHEFLADQFAVKENEKWNYAELLLMHLLGSPNLRFTHPFFHNQIKRRIAMITSSQQPKYQYFRKVMVLPLLFIIAGLFAFTYKQKQQAGATEAGLTGEITLNDSIPNSVREEKKKLPSPELIIINGKKYTEEEASKLLIGKEIKLTAGNVIYTKAGDTLALKEYGQKAKNGVIELREVKITKGLPLEGNILNEQVIGKTLAKPLYVIDGIVQAKNVSADVLQTLNPENIQSIDILKDITAVTKYGDDGEHGVVEITTKKVKELVLEKVKGTEIKEVTADQLSEVVVVGYASPKPEAEPSFPGGQIEWRRFLERNINSLVPIDKGASAGTYTVYVQFIVDQQGHISDIKALTEHGFGMEEEVIRVLKSGPLWVPGTKNGKAIKAFKKQPVTFEIIEEENKPDLKEVVVVGYQKEKLVTADIDKLSPIYPNPSSNNVTIPYSTKLEGPGEVRVLDMLGNTQQVVKANYTKGLNNLNINVSSLAKGTYIIIITDADKKITRRYKMIKE